MLAFQKILVSLRYFFRFNFIALKKMLIAERYELSRIHIRILINVMHCAIWYHMYNLKNVKNTNRGVLILVKLHASACNFIKINTPP